MVYYGYGLDHCRNMNDGYPSFNNKASSIRYLSHVLCFCQISDFPSDQNQSNLGPWVHWKATNMIPLHCTKNQLLQDTNWNLLEVNWSSTKIILDGTYLKKKRKITKKRQNTIYFRSAAITGCTAWTLYSNVNFGGSCVCLYPSDQNNCEVGLYKNLPLNIQNSVASVRRGCYCNYHKYPNAWGENKDKLDPKAKARVKQQITNSGFIQHYFGHKIGNWMYLERVHFLMGRSPARRERTIFLADGVFVIRETSENGMRGRQFHL